MSFALPRIPAVSSPRAARPQYRARGAWLVTVVLSACTAKSGAESPATSDSAPHAGSRNFFDETPSPSVDVASTQSHGSNDGDASSECATGSPSTSSSPPVPSATGPRADSDADDATMPDAAVTQPGDLGAVPVAPSPVTRGGTMTFTNVGAPGWWPRRLQRPAGDPACTYKDGLDTWGGQCCMTEHHTDGAQLAPFDEEMTLILKAIHIKQLGVYQPVGAAADSAWNRVTSWTETTGASENLWFTQDGEGSAAFPGDLTKNDCVGYVTQAPLIACDEAQYYCPNDPGVLHRGFEGSKLVVFLGSMAVDDDAVRACEGDGAGHPGPWVAFVASELVRDGGRKWNGACNCYSKTGSVGDGCGEINVFEVVMDANSYSNREFASTGVRSFQAGHVGGAVCGETCARSAFPTDVEVVDACARKAYTSGPVLEMGGATDGCPVWIRPTGDRYFFILLDEARRQIQVGVLHPDNLPKAASSLLPQFPTQVSRNVIDAMLDLRLPD